MSHTSQLTLAPAHPTQYRASTSDLDDYLQRRERRRRLFDERNISAAPTAPAVPPAEAPSGSSPTTADPAPQAAPSHVAEAPAPAAPPRPPTQPSTPDLSRIERPEPPQRSRTASRLQSTRISTVLLWAGFLCLCVWAGFNLPIHGTSSATSSSSGGGSTSVAGNHRVTPPQPTGALMWKREVSMAPGTVYGLDSVRLQTDVQDGVGPATGATFGGEALVVFRSTSESPVAVSAWRGRRAPTNRGCIHSLATAGSDYVQLQPPGISVGGWICTRTVVGHIAGLRLDGGDPSGGYRFHVTAWDH